VARRRRAWGEAGCLAWLLVAALVAWKAGPDRFLAAFLAVFVSFHLLRFFWRQAARARLRARLCGMSLEELDTLTGREFEAWIAARLEADGLRVRNLPDSGDFGLDLLVDLGGTTLGIQAKRYKGKVGNDAVMQAIAGCDYHSCGLGAVVTQSHFTKAARAQAKASHLPLLLADREDLPYLPEVLQAFARDSRGSLLPEGEDPAEG